MESNFDEDLLLLKIAAGDQQAFRVIYERYYHPLYAFCIKLLKDEWMAEEVIQEVFLKIWKQGSRLTDVAQLEAYLVTMARNRCYDHLRRRKLRQYSPLEELDWKSEQHNETEESIATNDTRRLIESAVLKLPPQQRRVYQLCHLGGYKYEEAGKELGLSIATVRFYMKLALRNLRKQLADHPDLLVLLLVFRLI